MKTTNIILALILIPVILFILFLVHATTHDYRPEDVTPVGRHLSWDTISKEHIFSVLIWNIGYAGLDRNIDFFYDGGKQVRPAKEQVYSNFENICKFIAGNDTVDFILLQEIDKASDRSYKINEVLELRKKLGTYQCAFGKNYDVGFVPVPFTKPLGRVLSGIVTFSKHKPQQVYRYSFPGNYAWPKKIFMLDRCFLVSRFSLSDDRELVLINTHNSAYDDGTLRKTQMEYLKEYIQSEFAAGNYVLAGGDWNQCPPLFKPHFADQPFDTVDLNFINKDYLPESWKWVYDSLTPGNRRLSDKYLRGKTLTTVIDFYLLSPNIRTESIRTIDLGFKNSDHQPVLATFKLLE